MLVMPNEQLRRLAPDKPEMTELIPFPIASLTAVRGVEGVIHNESYLPTGIICGLDPEKIYYDTGHQLLNTEQLHVDFSEVKDDCVALKIYAAETTGGFNIAIKDVSQVADVWRQYSPEKPIIIHAEDDGVREVIASVAELKDGYKIPLHFAHVSSRQELEAIIAAKKDGMNVTCEVTPHHLFLTDNARELLGGRGCMKPSLKPEADRQFLWDNIRHIDMIASDCAPHRISDKEAEKPAYGVTNHTVMLPLLWGAVEQGLLTESELFEKLCINPRKRFNLPLDDNSYIHYSTKENNLSAQDYEQMARVHYGENPFAYLESDKYKYVGKIVVAKAGKSIITPEFTILKNSYEHLILPR